VRFRLRQHAPEELLRYLLVQQPVPVLAEYRVIPHRFIQLQPHKPPEQQVVVHLFHQHPLAANRVEDLQQYCTQQSLRGDRWAAGLRIERIKLFGHPP
jgi:hypothetical protein